MWRITKFEKRSYQILNEQGTELGRLVHRSPWTFRSELFYEGRIYDVGSLKWYTNELAVTLDGLPVALCRNKDWNGRRIELYEPLGTLVATVEQPSMWRSEYRMLSPDGREMVAFRTRITWTSTYPEFEIVRMGDPPPRPFLLLLAIFAVTVRNWRAAAAG